MKGHAGVRWYRAVHVGDYPTDYERHCYEVAAQRQREREAEPGYRPGPIVIDLTGGKFRIDV